MSDEYPEDKILEFELYVRNMVEDINSMENILTQIAEWCERGLSIENACEPLNNQINEWRQVMDELIEIFKQNIITLKNVDDRIEKDSNTDVGELTGTYSEKCNYLCSIYHNVFENLKSDVNILNNVKSDINNYESLGINLGDATNVLNQQTELISNEINNSINKLQDIIDQIKDKSKKKSSDIPSLD